jgi:hypothetical protein
VAGTLALLTLDANRAGVSTDLNVTFIKVFEGGRERERGEKEEGLGEWRDRKNGGRKLEGTVYTGIWEFIKTAVFVNGGVRDKNGSH